MLVRDATRADVPTICELFNALIATTTIGWREHLTTVEEQLEWLQERDSRGQPTLVADDRGVIGYCCWTAFRGGERFPGYRHTVEHTVHVAEAHHRRGVGRLLVTSLMERAEAAGIHVMVAGIDADNQASIALHASLGFIETARMPEVGRKFDRWRDLVLMQRILGT